MSNKCFAAILNADKSLEANLENKHGGPCRGRLFWRKIAIYNRCELRMTHERKSARSVSCFARETASILPSLRKSGVNMARFKVFGNQKFASFSGW